MRASSAVDVDNLLVSQPDNGEQALEIAETLIRSGGLDVVVVDSVAALVPRAELEGEMGEPQMGRCRRGSCRRRSENLPESFRSRAPA